MVALPLKITRRDASPRRVIALAEYRAATALRLNSD